jgi:diacylglycerol kinase family enzyme
MSAPRSGKTTATAIQLSSESPCPVEGDGEVLGWLPAQVKMIRRQLNFVV